MILSLKQKFNTDVKNIKAPERFTVSRSGLTLVKNTNLSFVEKIPSSRFAGISVSIDGLTVDDEVNLQIFGLSSDSTSSGIYSLLQLESRFTQNDNKDEFQQWLYRDFTETNSLYVRVLNQGLQSINISYQITGETV